MFIPQDKANEVIQVKAHGIYSDLDEYVKVVVDWVDFLTEVTATLNEITQVIPYLSVCAAVISKSRAAFRDTLS